MKISQGVFVDILVLCMILVHGSAMAYILRNTNSTSDVNSESIRGDCLRCLCRLDGCPQADSGNFECLSNEHMCCCCLPNPFPCMDMQESGLLQSNPDSLAELEQGLGEIGNLE